MKILITIIFSSITLLNASAGDSPKKLMKRAFQAIQDKDAKALQGYLIVDTNRTKEIGLAVAELIVAIHSGQDKKFADQYKEETEKLTTRPLSVYMWKLFDIMKIPPFDLSAKNGEYQEEKNWYKVTYLDRGKKERSYTFIVKETDEGWKFWPRMIPAKEEWITTNNILKEYWAIFANHPKEKYASELDKLIRKYVVPTDLVYMDQLAAGKIENQTWRFKKGMAKKWGGKIEITLSDSVSTDEECPFRLEGKKVKSRVIGPGEFDLAFTDATMVFSGKTAKNLMDGAKIKVEIDQSAKIVKGQIAGNTIARTMSMALSKFPSARSDVVLSNQ